jgi:trk system potassium uptake protein TrkA
MGIDEIVHPEKDSAEKLAKNLTTEGFIDSFELSSEYSIVKAEVPERYEGKRLGETDIRSKHNINVLTIISKTQKRNFLGIKQSTMEVKEMAKADTLLGKGEILVIFGHVKDIEKFLE